MSAMPVVAQFRKYIQPAVYAPFSPRNSLAYDTNAPEDGRYSTSSPRARTTRKAKTPQTAYATNREGPASARRPPAPRKRPVPMAPPMAIMLTCRDFRDLL